MRKRAQPQKSKERRSGKWQVIIEREFPSFCREHPVRAVLLSAIWEELFRDRGVKPRDIMSYVPDWKRMAPDMRELVSYVSPPHPKAPKASLETMSVEMAKELVQAGVPHKVVLRLMARGGKPRRGRPVSIRAAAVDALEMKLADSGQSWAKIARKKCPCGQSRHDFQCRERIRQAVIALKKVLQKHQIPLPSESSQRRLARPASRRLCR